MLITASLFFTVIVVNHSLAELLTF